MDFLGWPLHGLEGHIPKRVSGMKSLLQRDGSLVAQKMQVVGSVLEAGAFVTRSTCPALCGAKAAGPEQGGSFWSFLDCLWGHSYGQHES